MARKSRVIAESKNNIPAGTKVSFFNPEKEEMYKKALPKEVVQFIEYDCAAYFAYAHVYRVYRKLGSKQKLIEYIKDRSRETMVLSFGDAHPCAKR